MRCQKEQETKWSIRSDVLGLPLNPGAPAVRAAKREMSEQDKKWHFLFSVFRMSRSNGLYPIARCPYEVRLCR